MKNLLNTKEAHDPEFEILAFSLLFLGVLLLCLWLLNVYSKNKNFISINKKRG